MPELHVLRVFVNEDGEWGNPLGVFLEGGEVPEEERQRVAAELGFSETVFVEDRADPARLRILTPGMELPFAGHPTVGTAWLLAQQGSPVKALATRAGEVGVRYDGERATFVAARPEWSFGIEYRQLASPADVRALSEPPEGLESAFAWAWIDEDAGTIRARCFVREGGIDEDEATGSTAIVICSRLGRPVTIHQGGGSVLEVAPRGGDLVEVGGGVRLDEVRDHRL
jgi:predicted PhzF superfamily epimerase YddE/YHI9